ncbi:MAG: DUF559 domain-containing protein [Thermoleophilia bacterium]|nr:DUF559 domain-containing protein [Thermoleophilia bacterium]
MLALGNGTHASHWSAAWLHGLIEAAPRVTHVTTSGRGASRPGVVVHHATSADTTAVCGVPVSVLPRTLLDLASLVPAARIANMLHELQFHEQLDALTLQSLRSVHHGHRGAATLTDALRMWDLGSAGAPSRFQLDVWEWVLSWAPMEPTLDDQVKTRIGMIRPDIHWRPQLVVVEADGRSVHDRTRTRRRDQVRTQALGELGYVVIRIEPDDFRWRRHLKRLEIEQALGRGRE